MRDFDLRALQLKELEMLEDFAKFCDDNGIVYYLMYGTLIGAARHQGFIPWDDDIDVVMDVKNYRKFLKCARKSYPDKYFVQNYKTDKNVWINWTKIRMNGTTSMERSNTSMDIHYGICMDIFPLVGKPARKLRKKLIYRAGKLQKTLLNKYFSEMTGISFGRRAKIMYKIIPDFLRIALCGLLERIIHIDTHASEFCYSPDVPGGSGVLYKSKCFSDDKCEYLTYEGKEYRVPYNWEEILNTRYGDWRTPPPVKERDGHGDIIVDLENDYKMYYTGK